MPTAEPVTLEQFIAELDALQQQASEAFAAAADADQLDQARVEFLGAKKGNFNSVPCKTALNFWVPRKASSNKSRKAWALFRKRASETRGKN
jgi:hypothetical protein